MRSYCIIIYSTKISSTEAVRLSQEPWLMLHEAFRCQGCRGWCQGCRGWCQGRRGIFSFIFLFKILVNCTILRGDTSTAPMTSTTELGDIYTAPLTSTRQLVTSTWWHHPRTSGICTARRHPAWVFICMIGNVQSRLKIKLNKILIYVLSNCIFTGALGGELLQIYFTKGMLAF